MKVLSRESLDKIDECLTDSSSEINLVDSFEEAVDSLGLEFVDTKYNDFDFGALDIILSDKASGIDDKRSDAHNCKELYEGLSWLSPADATDERFWVTLCFTGGNSYLKHRYRDKLSPKGVRDHWTWRGHKPIYRDNGLSRLWWMGFVASRAIDWNIEAALDVLLVNSDYCLQLMGRQEIVSNEALFTAILSITRDAFEKKIEYKREPFRKFMQEVQYLQARSNLGAIEQEKLTEILQPHYLKAFKVEKQNFMGRLLGN